jgi:pilus assembly protein CpaC
MRNHRLVRGRLNKIVWVALFWLVLVGQGLAAQQQVAPTVSVTINKSMVFRLAERAKRVSVSQPAVADVIVIAPSQLLINGKAIGTTSLIIFDEKGEVTNYDLVVAPDIAALRGQLRTIFPNERIEISTSGPSLVLRGEVSNDVVYDKVLSIVLTYLPPKPPAPIAPPSTSVSIGAMSTPHISGSTIAGGGSLAFDEESSVDDVNRWGDKRKIDGLIDMLVIKEVLEIELDVIVAAVSTSKLREIGFDSIRTQSTTGVPAPTTQVFSDLAISTVQGSAFSYFTKGFSLAALYRLIQNKNVSDILAQPRLVMKNGRSGGFLAGGEVPIVTVTANTFGVIFKPFGVRLDFVPTITWSDRIDLRVVPEVSEIDRGNGVGDIPGFSVRRTVSRVEMKEGESMVLGGLLKRDIAKNLTKIPLLGDIPILGALFRSTSFANSETELVFIITPRIVRAMKPGERPQLPSIEKFDDPDIRQVPLPGGSDEKKPVARGASIP